MIFQKSKWWGRIFSVPGAIIVFAIFFGHDGPEPPTQILPDDWLIWTLVGLGLIAIGLAINSIQFSHEEEVFRQAMAEQARRKKRYLQ